MIKMRLFQKGPKRELRRFLSPKKNIESETIKRVSIFSGEEIGLPIYLFQQIFSYLHYGENINIDNIFLFEALLGYVTYGTDRLIDSYEYKKNPNMKITDKKKEFYENILENENIVMITLLASYFICFEWLSMRESTSPFAFLLLTNAFYKNIKPFLGVGKPIFIGVMWVIASVILPSVAYSGNYDIIYDPSCYIPPLLSIMGQSNIADIKDIKEDKEQGVETIPVLFGPKIASLFTILTSIISSNILLHHPNFNSNLIPNIMFELNNFGIIIYTIRSYNKYNNTDND
jgi:hypothetical protein